MSSLSNYPAVAALPAKDAEKLKSFYEEKLGFSIKERSPDGGFEFESGGTKFLVFPSSGKASGDHTQIAWEVDDLDSVLDELTARGVECEKYDMEGFKSDDRGVVQVEDWRGVWVKDPEGNLLGIGEKSR